MFGVLVTGRLVQTNFQQVGENQFLFTIPDADNINFVIVFLTGITPFPDGMGGAVHFGWPDSNGQSNWQFLGYISNTKPSAIYKVSQKKKNDETNIDNFEINKISHAAQIGVSVEPLAVIEQQATEAAIAATANNINLFTEFMQKMMTNFMNYVSSFMVTQTQMVPNPTENFVPLSILQKWYDTFQRRLQQNPNFWKS